MFNVFIFIEKLPKKLSASFAFWRPCLLRQGVERLLQTDHSEVAKTLSPSVNLLCPQAWSSSFQDQQFVLVSTPRVHGSHKADTHLLVSQSASLNMKWQFTNLQWNIQMLTNPDFKLAWPETFLLLAKFLHGRLNC